LAQLGFAPSSPAALAVSGGGDSIALMLLFADWIGRRAGSSSANSPAALPSALIVDHGLREESAREAETVAVWANARGFRPHVLRWDAEKPQTGIEGKARAARYRLLGRWCADHDVSALFLAHTRDDQAETFLLRLGRGSGVDGLSGMQALAPFPLAGFPGIRLLRPLLDIGRDELRAYLSARGANWLEDPMNGDSRFTRVRIRKALPGLEAAGIPALKVAEAAQHLARARGALDAMTEAFLADHARLARDFALIDSGALKAAHREIGLRALSTALMRLSAADYRPRFHRLESLFDTILAGDFAARTLCGCRVGPAPKATAAFGPATLLITRERARTSVRKAGEKNERQTEPSETIEAGLADACALTAAPELSDSAKPLTKKVSKTANILSNGSV